MVGQVGLHAGERRGGIDRPVGAAPIGLETGVGGLLLEDGRHRIEIAQPQSAAN